MRNKVNPRRGVKGRKVESVTGPGTSKVVRELLDVMNKNGLTTINVNKSTLESVLRGEVKLSADGKFSVGNPKGFSTLESRGPRGRKKSRRVVESLLSNMSSDEAMDFGYESQDGEPALSYSTETPDGLATLVFGWNEDEELSVAVIYEEIEATLYNDFEIDEYSAGRSLANKIAKDLKTLSTSGLCDKYDLEFQEY